MKPEDLKDPAKVAAREKQIDDQTRAKLKSMIAKFVKLFAAAAGQPKTRSLPPLTKRYSFPTAASCDRGFRPAVKI